MELRAARPPTPSGTPRLCARRLRLLLSPAQPSSSRRPPTAHSIAAAPRRARRERTRLARGLQSAS
eukprot:420158-Lingulodinium_polyedra.AAC.1